MLDGIEDAFTVYPEGFISRYIKTIYIANDIIIEGAEAGGTYGENWIALSNTPEWNGTEANYRNARFGVHHELSSLILAESSLTVITWHQLMTEKWTPAASNSKP